MLRTECLAVLSALVFCACGGNKVRVRNTVTPETLYEAAQATRSDQVLQPTSPQTTRRRD